MIKLGEMQPRVDGPGAFARCEHLEGEPPHPWLYDALWFEIKTGFFLKLMLCNVCVDLLNAQMEIMDASMRDKLKREKHDGTD